jgi:hypothetical protein
VRLTTHSFLVVLTQTVLLLAADLNETSLEAAVIQIAGWTDERGLLIAAKPI